MGLLEEFLAARHVAEIARARRILALRAMVATGSSQRDIAEALGISQPAVSQQLRAGADLSMLPPKKLVQAAGPILRSVAEERGYFELAVSGSVARGDARLDSDIDLLVRQPPGTPISGLVGLRETFEAILGRQVDLVTYGGLEAGLDDDVRAEAVLLT
jgi:predicted nucleotidyltransferase